VAALLPRAQLRRLDLELPCLPHRAIGNEKAGYEKEGFEQHAVPFV
jgi:hypothetical protein